MARSSFVTKICDLYAQKRSVWWIINDKLDVVTLLQNRRRQLYAQKWSIWWIIREKLRFYIRILNFYVQNCSIRRTEVKSGTLRGFLCDLYAQKWNIWWAIREKIACCGFITKLLYYKIIVLKRTVNISCWSHIQMHGSFVFYMSK